MSRDIPTEQPREASTEAFVENPCARFDASLVQVRTSFKKSLENIVSEAVDSFEASTDKTLESIFRESAIRRLQAILDRWVYTSIIDSNFDHYTTFSHPIFQKNQNWNFVNIPEWSHKENMEKAGLTPQEYGKTYIWKSMKDISSCIESVKNYPELFKTFQWYFETIFWKLSTLGELGNHGEFRVVIERIDWFESWFTVFPNGRIESFETIIKREEISPAFL